MSRKAANEGIKNSLWITKGTFQFPCKSQFFPHEWVSRRGEKKFHHEPRSGEWWNFYLPQLLGHEWGKNCDAHGNWNVPWVMNREFSPSQIPKMIGFTFLLWKWKFFHHEWLISKVFIKHLSDHSLLHYIRKKIFHILANIGITTDLRIFSSVCKFEILFIGIVWQRFRPAFM